MPFTVTIILRRNTLRNLQIKRENKMNKIKLKHVITLVFCVVLLACLLIPSYALPMTRGSHRRMQRDIEEGTSAAETLIPMPEGNITEGETQDGIIGDDVVTTTDKPTVTTAPQTTERPALTTSPTTTIPRTTVTTGVNGVTDTASNGALAIWGIVLAVILAGAIVAVIMMTSRGKRR